MGILSRYIPDNYDDRDGSNATLQAEEGEEEEKRKRREHESNDAA